MLFVILYRLSVLILRLFSDTHHFEEEACVDWKDSVSIQIDFSLAVFFVVYYFIRFLAADDKLAFVLSIESLVDHFTVPPVFLTGDSLGSSTFYEDPHSQDLSTNGNILTSLSKVYLGAVGHLCRHTMVAFYL